MHPEDNKCFLASEREDTSLDEKYYEDRETGYWEICEVNCITCTSYTYCLSCRENYWVGISLLFYLNLFIFSFQIHINICLF